MSGGAARGCAWHSSSLRDITRFVLAQIPPTTCASEVVPAVEACVVGCSAHEMEAAVCARMQGSVSSQTFSANETGAANDVDEAISLLQIGAARSGAIGRPVVECQCSKIDSVIDDDVVGDVIEQKGDVGGSTDDHVLFP